MTALLADIASGNTDTADVLFLIGAIVFGLATLIALDMALRASPRTINVWQPVLVAAGLCLVSIAWLVL